MGNNNKGVVVDSNKDRTPLVLQPIGLKTPLEQLLKQIKLHIS
jgi:hypothetical protein